jgi:hypothetical protein
MESNRPYTMEELEELRNLNRSRMALPGKTPKNLPSTPRQQPSGFKTRTGEFISMPPKPKEQKLARSGQVVRGDKIVTHDPTPNTYKNSHNIKTRVQKTIPSQKVESLPEPSANDPLRSEMKKDMRQRRAKWKPPKVNPDIDREIKTEMLRHTPAPVNNRVNTKVKSATPSSQKKYLKELQEKKVESGDGYPHGVIFVEARYEDSYPEYVARVKKQRLESKDRYKPIYGHGASDHENFKGKTLALEREDHYVYFRPAIDREHADALKKTVNEHGIQASSFRKQRTNKSRKIAIKKPSYALMKKPTRKVVKKPVQKPIRKVVKKPVQKTVKRVFVVRNVRPVMRKPVKKVARKPVKRRR